MKSLILLLLCLPLWLGAQSHPACDSLQINCCWFDSIQNKQLLLVVSNQTSFLFDYPGFIIFDNNGDTIAAETPDYYGIGTVAQTHILRVLKEINIPFTGELRLYTGFGKVSQCIFPVSFSDEIRNHPNLPIVPDSFTIFPNPARDVLTIRLSPVVQPFRYQIDLQDMLGRRRMTKISSQSQERIELDGLKSGVYFLVIRDKNGQKLKVEKLVVE